MSEDKVNQPWMNPSDNTVTKPENPPAFPTVGWELTGTASGEQAVSATDNPGMTLRDYFAGQLMDVALRRHPESPKRAAEVCYEYADAMLAERSKSHE